LLSNIILTGTGNHGYESPKQALEINSAAELRGTDPAWGGIQLSNFNLLAACLWQAGKCTAFLKIEFHE